MLAEQAEDLIFRLYVFLLCSRRAVAIFMEQLTPNSDTERWDTQLGAFCHSALLTF